MLENLPLGLLPFEVEELFDNDLNFDNYGNVDYTTILNNELFVTFERKRIQREQIMKKKNESQDVDKLTDNRKVVVEDLMYIDDLEVIIYTTVMPKTSTIFVTHTKKQEKKNKVEIITLKGLSDNKAKSD